MLRITSIKRAGPATLTTCVGILLFSAYSSLLRFTKSSSIPRIVVRAVSRCFDWSGLLSILATFFTVRSFWVRQNSTKRSAKGTPIMFSSAMSMSLHCDPSSCTEQRPYACHRLALKTRGSRTVPCPGPSLLQSCMTSQCPQLLSWSACIRPGACKVHLLAA